MDTDEQGPPEDAARPEQGGLAPEVARMLAGYRPRLAPEEHTGLIVGLVEAVRPATARRAGALLAAVSGLVLWLHETGQPVTVRAVCDPDVQGRYLSEALKDYRAASRTAAGFELRAVSRAHGAWSGGLADQGDAAVEPAYTARDLVGLVGWARAQRTAKRRHALLAGLAAGVGCGLSTVELNGARGNDVMRDESDGAVRVRVTAGAAPRVVVCRAGWEDLLWRLAQDAGDGWLLAPHRDPRVRLDDQTLWSVVVGCGPPSGAVPDLNLRRCRATWVTAVLEAGVRLDVLSAAAGVDADHLLFRRLALLAPEPADRARQALRVAVLPPGPSAERLGAEPPIAGGAPDGAPGTKVDGQVERAAREAYAALPQPARDYLDAYRPPRHSRHHAPVARLLAAASGTTSLSMLKTSRAAATDLAWWAEQHGLPTTLAALADPGVVEAWASAPDGAARLSATSRAQFVRRLRAAAAALRPDRATGRVPVGGPYTAAELAALHAWADGQPGPLRGWLAVLLAVALGTGARPAELALARGTDVTVDPQDGAVLLATRPAPLKGDRLTRPRTVPCTTEHEDALLVAARTAGDRLLLDHRHDPGLSALLSAGLADRPPSPHTVNMLCQAAAVPPGVPALTALRCRTTWAAAQLASGTRPDTLMRAAGLASPANLHRYAAALPPLADHQAAALLRNA